MNNTHPHHYHHKLKIKAQDLPGDAEDKNLPANAGNMGSIPGLVQEDITQCGAIKPLHHNC